MRLQPRCNVQLFAARQQQTAGKHQAAQGTQPGPGMAGTTQTASVSRRQDVNEYTRTARNCFDKFIGNTLSVYVFYLTHKKQVPKNKRPHSKAAGPKKANTFRLALLGWFNLKMGTLRAQTA